MSCCKSKSADSNNTANCGCSSQLSENSGSLVSIGGRSQVKSENGVNRRDFLKIVGAGSAAAGLAGCADSMKTNILPYVKGEYDQIPGVAVWFRSTCTECSAGCGLMVRTREGRAVKVEGSPDNPINKGGLCALGQSSVQNLYDPDRVRQPLRRTKGADSTGRTTYTFNPISWDDAYAEVSAALKDNKKKAFITGELTGAIEELVGSFAKATNATHVQFDPMQQVALAKASDMVYGQYGVPQYHIDRADVLLNFGADFLETFVSPVEYARAWATSRKSERPLRVVQVEPRLSLTGANADMWLAAAPGSEVQIAKWLLNNLLEAGRVNGFSSALKEFAESLCHGVTLESVVASSGISKEKLLLVAQYLTEAKAPLILSGGATSATNEPLTLHVLAALLNVGLGAVGKTVDIAAMRKPRTSISKLSALIESMRKGEISVLMVHGANPQYALPEGFGYSNARNFVPLVVSFSSQLDETAMNADIVLPSHTALESWGDVRVVPGVYSLMQPVMQPVFSTQPFGESLLKLAELAGQSEVSDGAKNFEDYLKASWKKLHASSNSSADFSKFWLECVERGGYFPGSSDSSLKASADIEKLKKAQLKNPAVKLAVAEGMVAGETLTVLPFMSVKSFDGRAANRPWMQEMADPVSTTAWDAWAEVHPDTAAKLGLEKDDILKVRTNYGEVDVGVYVTPYVHKDVVAIPMGHGHTAYGRYAMASAPASNVIKLLLPEYSAAADSMTLLGTKASVERGRGKAKMLILSGSDSQYARQIGESQLVQIAANGKAEPVQEHSHGEEGHHHIEQMYEQREHPLYHWGLNVDLSACTGCSACVVACYAENNVPVVGKEQVWKGREMSWIQIQRYYEGPAEELHVSFVPMMCQQCQNAPCEPVCPVYATYHTEEGLNAMTYNRCVGTRYCANNCSYKVRRFNWFDYTMPEPLTWQLNPDVTKRTMGVMEKCTFCVQRIVEAKDIAKDLGRLVKDGEVKPACVQSCPTQALTFGNLKDKNSAVSKKAAEHSAYKVLDKWINTQPSITYLNRTRLEA